jgi:hypothetical protein
MYSYKKVFHLIFCSNSTILLLFNIWCWQYCLHFFYTHPYNKPLLFGYSVTLILQIRIYEGQPNSLTYMAWCTMGLYRLNRVLLVTSTCKLCRGCATQFGESSVLSDRDSGFCIMIMHQDTRPLLCSNSSPRKTSSHHPTTKFSGSHSEWHFPVPYSESGPQGDRFHDHGGHQMLEDFKTSFSSF